MESELDVANWTALRLRKMYYPTIEGKFMAGGKTPHQYLTAEIQQLLDRETKKARSEWEMSIDIKLNKVLEVLSELTEESKKQ